MNVVLSLVRWQHGSTFRANMDGVLRRVCSTTWWERARDCRLNKHLASFSVTARLSLTRWLVQIYQVTIHPSKRHHSAVTLSTT